MRKFVLAPSNVCHWRSSATFCTANRLGAEKVLPQSLDTAVVKLAKASLLWRPETATGAQPLAATASATERSASPPPVLLSKFTAGPDTNLWEPSGLRTSSMRQKLLLAAAGAVM